MSSFILGQVHKIAKLLQKMDNLSTEDILKMDMYEYYRELNQRAWDILSGRVPEKGISFTFVWCNRIIPSDRRSTVVTGKTEEEAKQKLRIMAEALFDIPESSVDILYTYRI